MNVRPIMIRHYRDTTGRKHGYRWECRLCGVFGIHRVNRWTDYVRAQRGRPDPHPWRRCMDAAELHLWRRHDGRTPISLTVNVNITTQSTMDSSI